MGVDYDSVCFLGWEVPPPDEPEEDENGEEVDVDEFFESLAEKHNVEHTYYGDGCYGGKDQHLLGFSLYGLDLAALKQCIATLETHELCAKYGKPKVHGGVLMW